MPYKQAQKAGTNCPMVERQLGEKAATRYTMPTLSSTWICRYALPLLWRSGYARD